jgi:hypothetical protein
MMMMMMIMIVMMLMLMHDERDYSNVLDFLFVFIFGDTPGSCLALGGGSFEGPRWKYVTVQRDDPTPNFLNDGTRHTALPSRLTSRLPRSLLSNIHSEQTLCAAGALNLSALN